MTDATRPVGFAAPCQALWGALGAAALSAPLTALAATLPAMEPGLWEERSTMHINGVDLLEEMRRSAEQQLQAMPPPQRAQAQAMMGDMLNLGKPEKVCVTPQEVQQMRDPQAMLEQMRKDSPHCTFSPVDVRGNTVRFSGHCNDPEGYTGDIQGEMTLVSSKAWTSRFTGKGKINVELPEMPGRPAPQIGGPVTMQMQSQGRWQGAQCGNVKP